MCASKSQECICLASPVLVPRPPAMPPCAFSVLQAPDSAVRSHVLASPRSFCQPFVSLPLVIRPFAQEPCTMLRARGLTALLEVSRRSSISWGSLEGATTAAASGSVSAILPAASAAACCSLSSDKSISPARGSLVDAGCRRSLVHTSAAAAATEPRPPESAAAPTAAGSTTTTPVTQEKVVLYRSRGMRLFRVLVRCAGT